ASRTASGRCGTTAGKRHPSITIKTAFRTASILAGTATARFPRWVSTRMASARGCGNDGTRKGSEIGRKPTRTTNRFHEEARSTHTATRAAPTQGQKFCVNAEMSEKITVREADLADLEQAAALVELLDA